MPTMRRCQRRAACQAHHWHRRDGRADCDRRAWGKVGPKDDGLGTDADPAEPASSGETPVGSVVTYLKGGGPGQGHDAGVAARDASLGGCQVAPGRPVPIWRDEDLVPGATVAEDQLSPRHPGQVRVRAGDVADIEPGSDQGLCRCPTCAVVTGSGDHQTCAVARTVADVLVDRRALTHDHDEVPVGCPGHRRL